MERHPRASSLSVDDMGLYLFRLDVTHRGAQTNVFPTIDSLLDARGRTFGSGREHDRL